MNLPVIPITKSNVRAGNRPDNYNFKLRKLAIGRLKERGFAPINHTFWQHRRTGEVASMATSGKNGPTVITYVMPKAKAA